MASWQDVLDARSEADEARHAALGVGKAIASGESAEVAGTVIIAADVLALEMRALSTMINYAAQEIVDALRFGR